MAVVKMKVTYADGREVEVLASPRAQVMAEERLAGENRVLLGHYYLAWASLYKAGKEAADFETWLDQIIDADTVDAKEPDPTQPAQPAGTSSD